MLRLVAFIALLSAGPCFAQTAEPSPAPSEWPTLSRGYDDPFVIAPDDCNASRFAHLVGESYGLHMASLPAGAVIHGPGQTGAVEAGHVVQFNQTLTLEYRPRRLNVVLDSDARIMSVSCH